MADDRDATLEQARRRDGQRAMLERTHDPARVLALSDGVFAIIITLLVLEVHVPELTEGQSLNDALGRSGRRSPPSSSASSWPACTGSPIVTCSR